MMDEKTAYGVVDPQNEHEPGHAHGGNDNGVPTTQADCEFLIVAESENELSSLVDQVVDLPQYSLGPVVGRKPPNVAMIRSAEPVNIHQLREYFGEWVRPNHVIVQMTHGRVLPISYPRPAPPGQLPTTYATSGVEVVVVDTAMVTPSPLSRICEERTCLGNGRLNDLPTADLHGTFSAAIVHRVAPRARVRLSPLLDPNEDRRITDWELACQLTAIVVDGRGPRVINLSLGAVIETTNPLEIEPEALKSAVAMANADEDVFLFAAAGNDDSPQVVYPAAFPGVFAVGAQIADELDSPSSSGIGSRRRGRPAKWSNGKPGNDQAIGRGGEPQAEVIVEPDFWAAGVGIRSTAVIESNAIRFRETIHNGTTADLPASRREIEGFPTGWAWWDGTSFATPIVAAECANALIDHIARNPGATATERRGEVMRKLEAAFADPHNGTSYQSGKYDDLVCREPMSTAM